MHSSRRCSAAVVARLPPAGPALTPASRLQASDQACEWTAEGRFHQSRSDPTLCKISAPMRFEVEKKEVQKVNVVRFATTPSEP
eukprot:SAG11_NODE_24323_length_375_cov_0.547101_1_plen_83_part_10